MDTPDIVLLMALSTRSLLENLRAISSLSFSLSNLFLKSSQTRNYVGTWYYAITCHAGRRRRNATRWRLLDRLENLARSDPALISLAGSFIGHKDWYYTIPAWCDDAIALDFPLVPDKGRERDRRLQLASGITEIARFNTIVDRVYGHPLPSPYPRLNCFDPFGNLLERIHFSHRRHILSSC